MDGDGIPLAFSINPGNENEQKTLKPLEEKIIKNFSLSRFIVCIDAGLSSNDNRKDDWTIKGINKKYNINDIEESEENIQRYKNYIFYKERWIKENGLEQKLIVTFSLKYKYYQKQIRDKQVERAIKAIKTNSASIKKCNPNDYKRFVAKTSITSDGEISNKEIYSLNEEAIYDGFYAVCTNLDDDGSEITKINHRR